MNDDNPLLCCRIAAVPEQLDAQPDQADSIWSAAARAYAKTEQIDPELQACLAAKDLETLKKILSDWDGDRRTRPAEDRNLLKRAMKGYRKRLKLTRLDDESRLGVGAMTKGGASAIFGIVPPNDYPEAVWVELARQGRLKAVGQGLYGLNE